MVLVDDLGILLSTAPNPNPSTGSGTRPHLRLNYDPNDRGADVEPNARPYRGADAKTNVGRRARRRLEVGLGVGSSVRLGDIATCLGSACDMAI